MSELASDYLLLAWVGVSILTTGIALCHALSRFRGIVLIGYGTAAGVVLHAVVGLGMALWPQLRPVLIGLLVALPFPALAYAWRRAVWRELFGQLSRLARWSLALWVAFLVACIGITHLQVNLPPSLPDGLYVFKEDTLNVRIQYLTSRPCDNYIPFIVTEYLLRPISFRDERPLLPNNEVSNRTILMSLVALPFRATLGVAEETPRPLGKFRYVGQDWPDVRQLNENGFFRQYLVVGIFLNSLLLVGLLVLFSQLGIESILAAGAFLYATNPYFIAETIFTWPKTLAAFFILLAWNSLRARHNPMLVAACLGLAYNCHPYAAAFALPLVLFYLWQAWKRAVSPRAAAGFALVLCLSVLPWLFWTRVYLGIPSNLLAQNFVAPGTPLDLAWIRAKNLFDLLAPRMFSVYPFDLSSVFDTWVTCLPGAVGLIVILPAVIKLRSFPAELRWPLILSGIAILLVFSAPALPILHGYQPIVGTLLFLGLAGLRETVSGRTFQVLVVLQLLCNLGLIVMRISATGLRLA